METIRIRGTVVGDLELPKLPAVWLGNWLLVQLTDDQVKLYVDSSNQSNALVGETQGLNLIDGLDGWIYDKESKKVTITKKARPIGLNAGGASKSVYLVLTSRKNLGEKVAVDQSGVTYPSSERLVIKTQWKVIQFVGEPFLASTERGYHAAVNVRMQTGEIKHIMLWAISLSDPLERIRLRRGGLDGLVIRICKSGAARTASYIIEVVP